MVDSIWWYSNLHIEVGHISRPQVAVVGELPVLRKPTRRIDAAHDERHALRERERLQRDVVHIEHLRIERVRV